MRLCERDKDAGIDVKGREWGKREADLMEEWVESGRER